MPRLHLLELARQEIDSTGQSFDQVKDVVRNRCIFTTHTPVPAGIDNFSPEQMDRYFGHYWPQLGLEREKFLNLGNDLPEHFGDSFNMAVLALRLCRAANGVSKINGEVCREMWSVLYPDRPVEKVPIGHITNGVHARTWIAPLMTDLYAQYLDLNWAAQVTEKQMWAKVDEIPDQEIWWRHKRLKERLIAYTRFQVQQARANRGEAAASIEATQHLLDANALTIGFARRFSTYEAYKIESDGGCGWAIGEDNHEDDPEVQTQRDAEALYQLLESEIIPCYYDQDEEGLPRRWIQMMKASIKTVAPHFNTDRMVAEYVTQMYLPKATAAVVSAGAV